MFDPNADIPILPAVKVALSNLGSAIKSVPHKSAKKKKSNDGDDEFKHSGSEPLSPEERLDAAVKKSNAANEVRLVAETNYFAELDNEFKLLQEYNAYRNPSLDNLEFTPISKNVVSALYKGKPVEIKCGILNGKRKYREITFYDDSKINYVLFSKADKMDIYGEEFEMPAGTIIEEKFVSGRMFSKLIQIPSMRTKVIIIPQAIKDAGLILKNYNL